LKISDDDVFHSGEWNLRQVNSEGGDPSDGLIVYEWRSEKSWKLIVVNLSDHTSQGRIPLSDQVSANRQYVFNDLINDVQYPRSGEELFNVGLFVRKDAFQAHLFDVTISQ
jgi:hypothetical protein